jgi:hypothetical protein
MRMFRSGSSFFSLEGIAREWCRSLPNASVSSLTDFHSAFNSFCKDYFPVEYLFEGCCEEFSSFHKALFVEEDTYHVGQEVLKDNSDISDIISNVSVVLNIDQNQHVSFGCIDVEKPMHISTRKSNRSTYLRSVANTMRSPHISDLQTQENYNRHEDLKGDEQIDQSVSESIASAVYVEHNPHFPDLQTKAVCNRHEEEDDKQKGPDLKQFAFNSEISKSSLQHLFNLQLDQQSKEVFLCEFDDPFADYLESMSNINPKIFLSDEGWSCHLFKLHYHNLWFLLSFGKRSNMILASQLLYWLLWKFSFT